MMWPWLQRDELDETKNALAKLGISIYDSDNTLKSVEQILKEMYEKWEDIKNDSD